MPAPPSPPPPLTRAQRARSLLPLPRAALAAAAGATPALRAALRPFRRAYVSRAGLYDVAAYVHAFGVRGPGPGEWAALFAAAARLRGEEACVLVAFALTGAEEQGRTKAETQERHEVVEDVVLGARGVPGILDKVCDMFEDWLVSAEALHDTLVARAEEEARRWDVTRAEDGRLAWRLRGAAAGGEEADNGGGRGEAAGSEAALGDGMGMLARRVGLAVARRTAEESVRRVSSEGVDAAVGRVRERGEVFVNVAAGRAMTVLMGKVMPEVARGAL